MSDESGIEPRVKQGAVSGDGSALTNLNASELKSGTVPDARLSSNVATKAYADAAAAAAKVGGTVVSFVQVTANTWAANQFIGIAPGASSATAFGAGVVYAVVPRAGVIRDLFVQAGNPTPGANHIVVYRASKGASPSFAATVLDALLSSTNFGADDFSVTGHSVSVAAGDLLVLFNNGGLWGHFGVTAALAYIPN